jgi:hypothetical protein
MNHVETLVTVFVCIGIFIGIHYSYKAIAYKEIKKWCQQENFKIDTFSNMQFKSIRPCYATVYVYSDTSKYEVQFQFDQSIKATFLNPLKLWGGMELISKKMVERVR